MRPTEYETFEEARDKPWEVLWTWDDIPEKDKENLIIPSRGAFGRLPVGGRPPYYKYIYPGRRGESRPRMLRHEIGHTQFFPLQEGEDYASEEFKVLYWSLKRSPGNPQDLRRLIEIRRFLSSADKEETRETFEAEVEAAATVGIPLYLPLTGYPRWLRIEEGDLR